MNFIALILLILQASSATALTRSDCKDYETCLGSNACKSDESCERRCQYLYLTCLSYADQSEK